MAAGATYEPIATITLSSAASSITFSSIAASWTDLRVIVTGTASANDFVTVQFNNDTGTNYSETYLFGNGSSASTGQITSANNIYDYSAFSNDANVATVAIDVFSYAGSTYKTVLLAGSGDKNGSGRTTREVGLWRSTSAITSIKLFGYFASNFNTGTTATLYGIKNA